METGGEGAIESVEAVRRVGEETVAEIRSLLQLVDPSDPRRGPAHGMADLERLVEGVRGSGLAVDLVVDGERRSLPDGLDVVAHRIVQESLTNVVRHAEASRASVTVTYLPDRLVLEVVDDGRGMSSGGATGLGIAGMRERTALYGGTCEVSAREEGGVRVFATLPLEPVGAPA
jgi:signal transduction histidine kinase